MVGSFMDCISEAPPADINIFGMEENSDIDQIHKVADMIHTSILFYGIQNMKARQLNY